MTDIPFFPLSDSLDHQIIMHCEAHFSGNFAEMLRYYKKQGKGVQNDFTLKQIQNLQKTAEQSPQKLFDLFLEEEEKEHVEKAKEKYRLLQETYETPSNETSKLVADLIFSESENPKEEIEALLKQSKTSEVAPALIQLLQSEEFYDPLFPGYAKAPAHAAECLGLLKEEKAISPLFQTLGKHDFETDEEILSAIRKIGVKARNFLLEQLTKLPISKDNENAALCLLNFEDDEIVSKAFLQMLQNSKEISNELLLQYLVLGCSHLKDPKDREAFINLSKAASFPKAIVQEMQSMIAKWKKAKK
jgi:hypothetical protein